MSEISYQIHGSDLQFVEVTLPPNTAIVGEQGAMMYMDDHLQVDTVLGDGSRSSFGGIGRFFKAFKRSFTGESLFSGRYSNPIQKSQRVAFAAPTLGKIIAVDLAQTGGELICQKGAFLAGESGTEVNIAWQKRLRVGFFGGEGFIMQRISGKGVVFINATGALTEMTLSVGETLRVDSGCLVGLSSSVTYDINYAGKIKTAIFGGEGLFYASLQGPGRVWIQSLPMSRLSAEIMGNALAGKRGMGGKFYVLLVIIVALFFSFFGTVIVMHTIRALLFGDDLPPVGSNVFAYFLDNRLVVETMDMSVDVADLIVSVGGFEHDEMFLNWQESSGEKWALKPYEARDIQMVIATAPLSLKPQLGKWHGRKHHIKMVWGTIAAIMTFCVLSVLVLWWQYDRALTWVVEKIPVSSEEKMGNSILEQLRAEGGITETGVAVKAVQDIGAKLTKGSRYQYQWVIKTDKTLNAFALPGGVVVVHSALIEKARNADELAAVLAHEVQHIEQRHSLKNSVNSLGWAALLTVTLGDVSAAAALMAHQMGAMYFSRDLEDEADRLGFQALIRANIKPDGMVTFFQTMAKEEKGDAPAWISSHPATVERIKTIQGLIEKQPCPPCVSLTFDWPKIQAQMLELGSAKKSAS